MKRSFKQSILCGAALAAASATSAYSQTFLDRIHGVDLSVDGGYVMGSGALPYAQYDDFVKDYAFKAGPGNGWSGAFAANFRFDDGLNFIATYDHTSVSRSAATPSYNDSNTPYDWPVWNILGYLNNRAPNGATSWNSATVSTDVHTDIIDLQVGHDVGLGTDGAFKLLGGIRIADFEQSSTADLYCSQPVAGTGNGCTPRSLEVASHRGSRFNGFGPSAGANYSQAIGTEGFGFYGSALASALLGKQTTSTWSTFGSVASNSLYEDKHVAFTVEARAALTYAMPDCPVVVMAGYQASLMDRVRDSENTASATGTDTFGSHQSDLLFHGPFVRLTYSPM